MKRPSQYTMIALGLAGLAGGVWEIRRHAANSLTTPHRSTATGDSSHQSVLLPKAHRAEAPVFEAWESLVHQPPPAPQPATAGFRKGSDAIRHPDYGENYLSRTPFDGVADLDFTPGAVEIEGFVHYGSPVEVNAVESQGQPATFFLTDSRGVDIPTREELEWRALKVEQEANHELKNLLQVLNLSEAEQDRVFEALAQRSHYYHPALLIDPDTSIAPVVTPEPETAPEAASPAKEPSREPPKHDVASAPKPSAPAPDPPVVTTPTEKDPIRASIPPEQLEAYEKYLAERDAFWTGVIEEIEAQLQQTTGH